MAKDLPGFYYDEEKGKYFRIQQSHRAVSGNNYTKQSIAISKQKKAELEANARRETRRRLQTVDQSKTRARITSLPLSARLGATPAQNRSRAVTEYARGLSRYKVGHGGLYLPSDSFVGSTFSITRSGSLRTAYRQPQSESQNCILNMMSCFRHNITATRRSTFNTTLPDVYPNIADHQAAELITTLYSDDQEYAILTSGGGPMFSLRPVTSFGEPSSGLELISYPRAYKVTTTWDLVGAPDTPSFVLATDLGLILGRCERGDNVSGASCTMLAHGEKMNAAFKDANVVISGERSGRIIFSDIRASAQDSVVRLLHSSAVLGTLGLPGGGGHQVLAHGYTTTSIYDLRYVTQKPIKKKARSSHASNRTVPCTNFVIPKSRWSDHYTRGRKVAYSADLGLVIAASSNTSNKALIESSSVPTSGFVTLYSVKTGKAVDSLLTRHEYGGNVRSVDVRRVRDGPESVFCLTEEGLDEWTVNGWDDDGYGGEASVNSTVQDTLPRLSGDHEASVILHDLSVEQEWDRGNQVTSRICY